MIHCKLEHYRPSLTYFDIISSETQENSHICTLSRISSLHNKIRPLNKEEIKSQRDEANIHLELVSN